MLRAFKRQQDLICSHSGENSKCVHLVDDYFNEDRRVLVAESARDHQHQSIARQLLYVDVGLDQRVLLDSVNGRLDPLE